MRWIDDFFELYKTDLKEALALKNKNIPNKFYRYRSFDFKKRKTTLHRSDEFRGNLYVSHFKDFDDIFEISSILQSKSHADYICDDDYKAQLAQGYKSIMDEAKYKEIFDSDDYYQKLLEYISEISGLITADNNFARAFNSAAMHRFEELNKTISDMSKQFMRVACFTVNPKNIPMWYYYADKHKGICLEYEPVKLSEELKSQLFPVRYTKELPDAIKLTSKRQLNGDLLFRYLASHKSEDWKFEDEWRLIVNFGAADDAPLSDYEKGMTISFLKPTKVICGAAMDEKNKNEVKRMAEASDIEVLEAKKTEYGLAIDGIKH